MDLPLLRELIVGFLKFNIEHNVVCKLCALGKKTREAFPNSETRSKGMLDLVHSNIYGPISLVFISRSNYFITSPKGFGNVLT